MSLAMIAAVLLGLGVVLAGVRFAGLARGRALPGTGWILVLGLQPVAATLLFLALFPVQTAHRSDRLVVATAGTTAAQLRHYDSDASIVALPEAPALIGATRVPDLGTALRRYPQTAQLLVLGYGLPARDRELASGVPLRFEPAPLPRGLVELQSPSRATVGSRWPVSGVAHALPGGSAELLEPSGRRADRAALTKGGRFLLHGNARAPGRARFRLRLRDAKGKIIERVGLPMQIDAGSPVRVLMLAGGPSPELKYLRRWAIDAGVSSRTQISVGAGLRIGDAPVSIDAATLRGFDLVVLDERAWRELGAARKAALREALDNGLGVLLRITGPLFPAERRDLQALGFTVTPANIAQTISLPSHWFDAVPPTLTRQSLRVASDDGVALLRDDAGSTLALWRNQGQGRIALWWLGDTYQIALTGQAPAHGRLWSQAFATLARARAARSPWLTSQEFRPHQRLVACGLRKGATVQSSHGSRTSLLVETTGDTVCAAYWPQQPGWHLLRSDDTELAFVVRAVDEATGLSARANGEATRHLVSATALQTAPSKSLQPGPRWPWFLGWLLVTAILWWLERRCLRN